MIDFTKPVKTKLSSVPDVRILCTDIKVNSEYTVLGLLSIKNQECTLYWDKEGHSLLSSKYDLENIPEEVITYKNVYADSGQSLEFSNLTECLKHVAKSYQPLFIVEMTKNKEGKVLEAKIVHYYV